MKKEEAEISFWIKAMLRFKRIDEHAKNENRHLPRTKERTARKRKERSLI